MLTTDTLQTEVRESFFVHQAFLDYQTESFEAVIGRTDNPNAHIVDFPTLREDDLLTLTNPLDPYSNGETQLEHRYSNAVSVTLNQNFTYSENLHAQHLLNSAGIGSESGINSFGATFEYLGPPGLEAFQLIPSWGFGYEHETLNANSPGGLHQIYGGGVINLNQSVTDRFDFRLQDILSLGSDLVSIQSASDSFQANSNSVAGAFRYLHSPFGKPGFQLSLTAAFKNYLRVSNANSFGWVLTGVKRLGQGFDAVAQVRGQWRDQALAAAQSGGLVYEQMGELGFIFNFDLVVREHISPRRSLLNQQHQYLPN
jgi:hypothetical protein